MTKLFALQHGCIFKRKDGVMIFIENEKLNATALEKDKQSGQLVRVKDDAAAKLKQQIPIEHEFQNLIMLGLAETLADAETVSPVAGKKAAGKGRSKKAAVDTDTNKA